MTDERLRIEPAWFLRPEGIHGVLHAERVLTHALAIAQALSLSEAEREAVALAAMWHDIGRTDDRQDWTHGMKSVSKALDLGLHAGRPREVVDLALFAMEHHAMWDRVGERRALLRADSESALRVFKVLKDADGLDRVRLGDLDPSFLRLDASKERVGAAQQLFDDSKRRRRS